MGTHPTTSTTNRALCHGVGVENILESLSYVPYSGLAAVVDRTISFVSPTVLATCSPARRRLTVRSLLHPGLQGYLAYWDKSVAMSTTNAEVTLNTAASVPFSMLSLSAGRGRHRLAPFVSQNLVTGCVSRALTWQIILTLTQAMAQPIHAASHSASSASSCDGIRSVEAVSALE